MTSPPLYFTATLSQALNFNKIHHNIVTRDSVHGVVQDCPKFKTVPEFVDFLAENYPDNLAAGCPFPGGDVESLSI